MMTDQQYLEAFRYANKRENRFAFKALKSGIKMLLMPHPDSDYDLPGETDQGDMILISRIEHKVRYLDFTCREDYPFKTVHIDEVYKIRNKPDKAFMYVLENKTGTHAAVVYSYTFPLWTIKDCYDQKRSRNISLYEVEKRCVRFCKIEEVF